jgi:hypothetical protein
MAWTTHVLVLANVTANSAELRAALRSRAESGPTQFTLIVPGSASAEGRQTARDNLSQAVEAMQADGLEVQGRIGNADPVCAVSDEWDPRSYDEIILSTLPTGVSRWLHAGLPERIERLTGARVTHVESAPAKPAPSAAPVPAHEKLGVMAPLSVLAWGAHRDA